MGNPILTEQAPTKWTMKLYCGNTWPAYSFTIQDSLKRPRDLSGAQVRLNLKDKTGNVIKSFSEASGFTIGGAGNATVTFSPVAVDMPPDGSPYVGDLVITYGTGQIKTYFTVSVTVTNKK